AQRRQRALQLADLQPFVREPMRLMAALAGAQETPYQRALEHPPAADELVAFVVRESLPAVMDASMSAGTELLRESVLLRFHEGDLQTMVRTWLEGGALADTDAFIARAAIAPVLEAAPDAARSLRGDVADERRCPLCGGLPQLAVFRETGETLVTGPRQLVCARCATEWAYPRMTCVSCRETEGAKMPILADETKLPHLRVDACDTCRSYLVTVDVRRDPRAVPLVDEIAALPLDLLATERGYTKISRNVMGF
ncbi:MAG TPA: formate dehydrogenase accessory protein FdhE, partial [Candidatus Acidoferrales bacterium]|nr:formate dehydrogenase accessory protein FdhE [Candidatus Acidoferrales bacterium]